MRKYRHRASGAIFETEMDMPTRDWEPLDEEREPEKPKAQATRKRTRKTNTPKE